MICIVDNLISEQDVAHCARRIKTVEPSEIYLGKPIYDIEHRFSDDEEIIRIVKIIEATANQFCLNIEIDWAQLVVWPHGTHHNLHRDDGAEETVFTSITYLNCDYRGGETYFSDGTTVAPLVGRTVFFDGKKYLHGVKTINHGQRISLPIWYKLKHR